MLMFQSDGPKLINTSYFESEWTQQGLAFLSWNAGAARLLIPDALINYLEDMKDCKYVVISHGLLNGNDAYEIMFEDESQSPFCLHISVDACDRVVSDLSYISEFDFSILTSTGVVFETKGKYRKVKTLPCRQRWAFVDVDNIKSEMVN
jgi:hypothetical protein